MNQKIELEDILRELHNISGFRISIYDAQKNQIATYPEEISPFCQLIQQNPKGKAICLDTDQKAFETVSQTGEPCLYQCRFGLYEAVAPLYYFGVHAGFLMMGQVVDTSEGLRDYLYQTALPYCGNKAVLLREAIDRIPASTKDKILSCITIMNICAEYITLGNRMNLTGRDLAQEVLRYLHEHYASPISLSALCGHFFCSKATLTNTFKATYGMTIHQCLTQVRLQRAKELLGDCRVSIRAVSEQCGFSDQNYFSKVFFREFHMTPSQYRSHRPDP